MPTHTCEIDEAAAAGLDLLRGNSCPGRIIVVGKTQKGHLALIYAITGLDVGEQNRRFIFDKKSNAVKTQVADPAREKKSSVPAVHNVIRSQGHRFAVGSGPQTDDVLERAGSSSAASQRGSILCALQKRRHEGDDPHFTSRITARCVIYGRDSLTVEMATQYRAPSGGTAHACTFFEDESLPSGFGYGIWTYSRKESPLPQFNRQPVLLPIVSGAPDALVAEFWEHLPPTRRAAIVAMVVRNEGDQLTSSFALRSIHD